MPHFKVNNQAPPTEGWLTPPLPKETTLATRELSSVTAARTGNEGVPQSGLSGKPVLAELHRSVVRH